MSTSPLLSTASSSIAGDSSDKLIVFFDGRCPLCVLEMQKLAKFDRQQRLLLWDIHRPETTREFPQLDLSLANRYLHAVERGQWLYGLDVTCRAWQLVGRQRWLRVLRWPLIKPVADVGYRLFAKHRLRISRWLLGSAALAQCQCAGSAGSCDVPVTSAIVLAESEQQDTANAALSASRRADR